MTKQELFNAPKCAGIYYFKNNINGKYYIGQAVKLRKRLLHHISVYINNRYDIPIYRAFKKYGIENFSWGVIVTIHDALSKKTKEKLDELEKKYIQEYNSYGKTGYNATLGGDAGVLGLRQSEETKKHLKELALNKQTKKEEYPENWIKALNIYTGFSIVSISKEYLARRLNVSICTIKNCLLKRQKTINNTWLIVRYLDDFPSKEVIENFKKTKIPSIKIKITEILNKEPFITPNKVSELYGINRNTFMYYRRKLNKVPKQRSDTKVTKEEFIKYSSNHSKKEVIQYFKMPESSYYKYKKKYERTNT